MKAIEKDSRHPRAYGWLGFVYQQASGDFSLGGDARQAQEFGELALKAFDEGIRREDDVNIKAELWWQRGNMLRSLKRQAEASASDREADALIPGFTASRGKDIVAALQDAARQTMKK